MQESLEERLFQLQAHWFYFSLNGYPGPFTFPKFDLEKIQTRNSEKSALYRELTMARKIINYNKEILVKAAQGLLHNGLNLLQTGQAERALEKIRPSREAVRGI